MSSAAPFSTRLLTSLAGGLLLTSVVTPTTTSFAATETTPATAAKVIPTKLDAEWILDTLGDKTDPKLPKAIIDKLLADDLLKDVSAATLKRILALEAPDATEKNKLEPQVELTIRLLKLAAPKKIEAFTAPVLLKRDLLSEPREKYKYIDTTGSGSQKTYGWAPERNTNGIYDSERALEEAKKAEAEFSSQHMQANRLMFSGRVGYENVNYPKGSDSGGAFFGVRYYGENVFRLPLLSYPKMDPNELGKIFERKPRAWEIDFWADVDYRKADTAKTEPASTTMPSDPSQKGALQSAQAVSFTTGLYMPLNTTFPRALLFDFSDDDKNSYSTTRGEAGFILGFGAKAFLDNTTSHNYQKFIGGGIRVATFRPDRTDPISYIDFLIGNRSGLNTPRAQIQSHYRLYTFNERDKNRSSTVDLYGFGGVELDLKQKNRTPLTVQDSLRFGLYLRYELDRIKGVFGSVLP